MMNDQIVADLIDLLENHGYVVLTKPAIAQIRIESYNEGYKKVNDDTYDVGHRDGYREGYKDGEEEGYFKRKEKHEL